MNSNSSGALFLTGNNLDSTYTNVSKSLQQNIGYNISNSTKSRDLFNKMAVIISNKYNKADTNLTILNDKLINAASTEFTKIYNKRTNPLINNNGVLLTHQTTSTSQLPNVIYDKSLGFSIMRDNNDISQSHDKLLASRQIPPMGDGRTQSYIPSPSNTSSQYNPLLTSVQSRDNQQSYSPQLAASGLSITNTHIRPGMPGVQIPPQNSVPTSTPPINKVVEQSIIPDMRNVSINNFNITGELFNELNEKEQVDMPLYRNIDNLQQMDTRNPMDMIGNYMSERSIITPTANTSLTPNSTSKSTHIQKNMAENIKNQEYNNEFAGYKQSSTNGVMQSLTNMELYDANNKFQVNVLDGINERMVNDNDAGYAIPPQIKSQLQDKIQVSQRKEQPKYIETTHYISVSSGDRDWYSSSGENRYKYQVKFAQAFDPNNSFQGANINRNLRNVVSIEPVVALLPIDAFISTYDTRLYFCTTKYPYLLLHIDEMDGVFSGTNSSTDRAFSTLIYDKMFHTDVLSSYYATSNAASATSNGIVVSNPAVSFANEFKRGFIKYNPAYFEKKKFYNNPLASINKLTITLTDNRGFNFNAYNDVVNTSNIAFINYDTDSANLAILPTIGYPYNNPATQPATPLKMLKITLTNTVSNRLFRIGDTIQIYGVSNTAYKTFLERPEGHIIVNTQVENNSVSSNKSFIQYLYIAPPGEYNTSYTSPNHIDGYVDGNTDDNLSGDNAKIINLDLQTNIMFRIVTRDVDVSSVTQPINVY